MGHEPRAPASANQSPLLPVGLRRHRVLHVDAPVRPDTRHLHLHAGSLSGPIVRLSDFTDFTWDRVGFYPGTPYDGTEAARLGLKSFEPHEFENSILFMEGDRIVRRDRMPYHCGWFPTFDPDPVYIGTVFLGECTDAADWGVFTRDDDRFEVTEENMGPEPTYWLHHVPAM